jgi:hypothetical protein
VSERRRQQPAALGGCGAVMLGFVGFVLMLPGLCTLLLVGKSLAEGVSVTPILGIALFTSLVAAVGFWMLRHAVRAVNPDRPP